MTARAHPGSRGDGLPKDLAENPRLSQWVDIGPDGGITVRIGKVEFGQGIRTAMAQIAAEELDVHVDDVHVATPSTSRGPDQGVTAGSMSTTDCGEALAQVCAEVRALLVSAAAASWGTDTAELSVRDGVVLDPTTHRSATYADLAAQVDLDSTADGTATPKTAAASRVVGMDVPRLDLPAKITGRPSFVHDLALPGQVYGRVVRPPSPAARLLALDDQPAREIPGVLAVVRDGSFVGVVAVAEDVADQAAAVLRDACEWKEEASLPDENDLSSFLRGSPVETTLVEDHTAGRPGAVVQRHSASYSRPFLAHASMAPSCAVARWDEGAVTVWSHSQGIHRLRRAIAMSLDIDDGQVTVHHAEGAGCYGHNGADDVAFDAVLLARAAPGLPVQVMWSRRDELSWSPFGSAMVIDVEAGLDRTGQVREWSYDVWSHGHTARPGYAGVPGLLAAAHRDPPDHLPPPVDPPQHSGAGTARNAVPLYAFDRRRVRAHRALRVPLRTSALRALGSFANVFAIESFMDELASAAGRDPLEYRLAHLDDPRGQAVLEAAAHAAGWPGAPQRDSVGQGVGFCRYKGEGAYCAVVAEVEAQHDVRVHHLWIAADAGRVVNPDGVRNQLEGGAVQATSWTLKERVRFDRERVTSVDWESYPILRVSETPRVDTQVISRPAERSVGVGEAVAGPTAAAIGNALAAALPVRIRDLPITTQRVLDAIGA
jgi:nicotinate dehydrogenase subunit B